MAPSLLALLWYYLTGNLQELRLNPGDRLQSDAQHLFIVTRGTGQVVRNGPGGHDILLRIVKQGAMLKDGDQLMAETNLELLALPAKPRTVSTRDRAGA